VDTRREHVEKNGGEEEVCPHFVLTHRFFYFHNDCLKTYTSLSSNVPRKMNIA
jgi:hypothetical protein